MSEISTSSTFSSSNAAGNSVISTSSIIMYSDINVSTAFSGQCHGTTSTTANSTITKRIYSYLTPTTTALYNYPASTFSTSSSGRMFSGPIPTPSISSMGIFSKPTLTPADPTLFGVDKPSSNLGFIYTSRC
ncbi:hypothetical protein GBAR_LOCUS4531 [Geodia barretti]|uniref:Uncharacterized protein n=1 Tax=Geodia barretti TaxID=519541 RepID=A0AA35W3C5_GEOBA|nr:hypothetical protein GBAR_LOCUS4531 [Geodia barretti]